MSPTCVLMAPRTSGMMTWTPKSRSGRRLTCSHALFLLCRSLPLPLHLIPFTKAATPVSFFAQLFNLKSFAFFYFFLPAQSQDPAIPHFSLPPKPPGSQIQLGFHAPLTLLSLLRSDCPVWGARGNSGKLYSYAGRGLGLLSSKPQPKVGHSFHFQRQSQDEYQRIYRIHIGKPVRKLLGK